MNILLQLAFAAIARIDLATLRRIWTSIEGLVSGFEVAKLKDMTGAEKLEYVLERTRRLIPEDRQQIATLIIRAIVEIVLIGIRLSKKGGAK